MNLFQVLSFLSIVLLATLTRPVLSDLNFQLESFSAKLGSERRHDYPYARISPVKENPNSFSVMAKKMSMYPLKGILDFDSTNMAVTYLSKTTMKTMSTVVVHATKKLEFLLCGLQFKGINEATKFFNEHLKQDCTKFLDLYEFSKIFVEKDGRSGWLGNGGGIIRRNVEGVVFTYTIKSDEPKVLIIFSTGNYMVEPTHDNCQLKITTRATVGAYQEAKTYTIMFKSPRQKELFYAVLMADEVALNGRVSATDAASSSSSRIAGTDDDDGDEAGCDASLQEIELQNMQSQR